MRARAHKAALLTGVSRLRARRRTRGIVDSIFLWIPKTAGTSLWRLLEARGGGLYLDPTLVRRRFPNRGLASFGHMRYCQLVAEGLVSRRFDERAYKFCIVRDPYDRAVSLYHYLRSQARLPSEIRFEEFTELLRERRYERIGLFNSIGLSQCNPQVAWLHDDDGNMLACEIGRFENLTPFVRTLRGRFGIAEELPHLNRTTDRRDRRYYASLIARQNIEECYAADYETFGYS